MAKTLVFFNDGGQKYCAEIACQNGSYRLLRAIDEAKNQVFDSQIEAKAILTAKRIGRYGYIEKPTEPEDEDERL